MIFLIDLELSVVFLLIFWIELKKKEMYRKN